MKKINVGYMTKIAVLSAIAVVLMLFEIPLWFAPGFYKLDISETVVLIGGFAMGPLAAVIIEFIKIMLNLLINGTITAGIGELANFIMGISFVVPAALIYRRNKTVKTAYKGLIVGTVSLTLIGSLMNLFVLLPAYSVVMPIDAIIEMGKKLNGSITGLPTFVLMITAPFNLLKGVVCSILALALYKRVSPILHKTKG